jgi:hypothetical protein
VGRPAAAYLYAGVMPDPEDFDPDERFSLYPTDPVEGLRRLLGADDLPQDGEDGDETVQSEAP